VNDARIKAMLKWSRKQLMQRKNRLLPKHADERFWGTAESQWADRRKRSDSRPQIKLD
jgi:hypothetical protein